MGMWEAQVSDDERNALVRPRTRVEVADAEAVAAAATGAGVYRGDAEDEDRMYMDVDSLPSPSPPHSTRAGPSQTPSRMASPSRPPSDDMMGLQCEITEAQCAMDLRVGELLDAQRVSDQWMAALIASFQTSQTQVAWLTRVNAEDYDRDREAPPPPSPPAP
ncbi:hypothetical protein NE237_020107 [Protea cynaroides]|uniref:Uncharacterized protein n=1 Tax=Protea cynaroides TaxID=273540 RepID=A0A9Q0K2A7_9MAGN|nr:hypothetical protein NE237_020107 [Protea cynaroides]